MAGIGFTLKKLFREETYTNRGKAYLYSTIVAAGPWIAAVVTVNFLIFIMELLVENTIEREVFMGTIVYSFVFSQILTAPWQLIITRYISDKLYSKDYAFIRPSFIGLNKIIVIKGLAVGLLFYFNKPLPVYYKVMSVYLFILLNMIWIMMVYASALKNYDLIAKAYIYGGLLSAGLSIWLLNDPLPFPALTNASNLMLAYLIGMSLTFLLLIYTFLSTFYFGNNLEYDFLRYLNRVPSLFFIGFFYTTGLWVDDLVMWFSLAGVKIYDTFLYAPVYDNAVFLAYLTIIPSMVLFMVSVETEFYDCYKNYYGLANQAGTLREIENARFEMKSSIYRKLFYTLEIQTLISVSIILLSSPVFEFLNYSFVVHKIFRICTIGALFNIFILLIILVLLYFEVRKQALAVSVIFFLSNWILTVYYSTKGLDYYGYGFFLGSLITAVIAAILLVAFMRRLNFVTFAHQPLFYERITGIFTIIADLLNYYKERELKKKEHGGNFHAETDMHSRPQESRY